MGADGELRAFADDVYVACDPLSATAGGAVDALRRDARADLNLESVPAKQVCYSRGACRAAWRSAFADFDEGELVDGDGVVVELGVKVMGVPVGDGAFVEGQLAAKAGKCVSRLDTLVHLLRARRRLRVRRLARVG